MARADLFLPALFSGYPHRDDLRVEVRCLPPMYERTRPRPWPRRWYCLAPEYLANALRWGRSLSMDWDVYFGVLPRTGHSGGQEGVPYARCLYGDIEGGEEGWEGAVDRIRSSGLPYPDIAVKSGGGVHSYWLLKETVELSGRQAREGFKRVLRRLALAIGGEAPAAHADGSACECARILRMPSTRNLKEPGNPRAVRLLRLSPDGPRPSYADWLSLLPVERQSPQAAPAQTGYMRPGIVSEGLLRWAERGYPEGRRHQNLLGAGFWLVHDCGLDRRDVSALLWRKAQNSPGRRVITREECDAIVAWV